MTETQQPETLLRQEDSASEATHCGRPPLSTLFLSFLRLTDDCTRSNDSFRSGCGVNPCSRRMRRMVGSLTRSRR
jgi:hypothetical protein